MNVDFSTPLRNLNGTPLQESGKGLIAQEVCINALLASYPDERGLAGKEKLNRYALAKRIFAAATEIPPALVTLAPDEVVTIKRLVALAYGPIIVGQIYELLGGERE